MLGETQMRGKEKKKEPLLLVGTVAAERTFSIGLGGRLQRNEKTLKGGIKEDRYVCSLAKKIKLNIRRLHCSA